ncbi:hypothetical protein CHLNCDRAFT_141910 [Chlorella variabilis]|uniref:Uncharacterized protein CMS n=1 Tax=Chlorella variabilis TaxID=554065 RepID=E1Z7B5_CHLVA|nr:hypothetical protein CHLNCDRAFT_141910 [Chlorella variabilis]EFN57889.1 hypothetical protein CHLNCDRAFT_141910 [Chlorella variabilis]|eukprot:XP_005849991.1 hypothetical protein CHLNCDRAFT_141910 [Chlorella variabilis]
MAAHATFSGGNGNGAGAAVKGGSVSLVLLAGGVGKRMGAAIPKQYLELQGQPVATYSLQMFAGMPQVIRPPVLREGFALVAAQGLEVTDDVSIVEALGRPVRITPGSYTNIKVTTPDDMSVAGRFLEEAAAAARGAQAAAADPLEAARVEYCEKVDPSARECKVFDE